MRDSSYLEVRIACWNMKSPLCDSVHLLFPLHGLLETSGFLGSQKLHDCLLIIKGLSIIWILFEFSLIKVQLPLEFTHTFSE